jgi:hypothetical protein
MHHHKDAARTAYCRRQACTCGTAALATNIAEVKQAYLDLEQGWLALAPKVEQTADAAVATRPLRDDATPDQGLQEKRFGDVTCHDKGQSRSG